METRGRSVLNAVIWNGIGLFVMSIVGLLATGSATVGGMLAVINTAIGFTLYIVYERIWARIRWGRAHG